MRLLGVIEHLQESANLFVEFADFTEVGGEGFTGDGVVVQVGRYRDLGGIVRGASGPWAMRIIGGEDDEPGLSGIASDEGSGLGKIVGSVDVLIRKGGSRADVRFVLQGHAVAGALQVGEEAFGAVIDARVVWIGAAADGVETGVERVSCGRARGCRVEHAAQVHGLGAQFVEVWGFDIGTAFVSKVTPAEIIGDDDHEVGSGLGGNG